MTRTDIIRQARLWLGTRYHHQARTLGVSVDCVGLIKGVCDALGYPIGETDKYNKHGLGEAGMIEEFAKYFDPVPVHLYRPGDILGFELRYVGKATHAAIATPLGMLHTHALVGRVVEHHMDDKWRKLLKWAWQFRSVEGD